MDDTKEALLEAVIKVLKALPEKELKKLVKKYSLLPGKRGRKKQPFLNKAEMAYHLVDSFEVCSGKKKPQIKRAAELLKYYPQYKTAGSLRTRYNDMKKFIDKNPGAVEKYLLKVLNALPGSFTDQVLEEDSITKGDKV